MSDVVRVLIIEDKDELAADAKREIEEAFENSEDINVRVSVETDFEKGFERVRDREGDVVVLDVRRDGSGSVMDDDRAGQDVYSRIRETCFTPIVFWTALPDKVNHQQMTPLVTVVTKEDTDKLPDAIRVAVSSGALATIRNIEKQVADVLRDHMWEELSPNWLEYVGSGNHIDIAPVLLSRLARVLEKDREQKFTNHASHRYIYPIAADDARAPGDILRGADQTWWVILTPACDLVHDKADLVLLCQASVLQEHEKYVKWSTAQSGRDDRKLAKEQWNNLAASVLKAASGRYRYLPAFRDIPDLVIDLQNIRSIPRGDLSSFTPVAALASPFVESLLVQNGGYWGRIGVPELDTEDVKRRLLGDLSS